MRVLNSIILLALLSASWLNAQNSHYWSQQYGNESLLLGLQLATKGTAGITVPTAPTTTVAAVRKRLRSLSASSEDIQIHPRFSIIVPGMKTFLPGHKKRPLA